MRRGKGVLSIFSVLLSLFCILTFNVNTVAAEDRTEQLSKMFLQAIVDGDLNTAQSLLDSGADINFSNGGTTHALALAFQWHRKNNVTNVVSFLISRGANVNATYKVEERSFSGTKVIYNFTPLRDAVTRNYSTAKAIQLLVENGANINAANSLGYTPLHYAVHGLHNVGVESGVDRNRISGQTLIKYLITKGGNPNYKNSQGVTPFHVLMYVLPGERANANSDYLALAKFMIKYGADPNLAVNGKKPIDFAYERNNVPVYQYLLGLENGSIPKPTPPSVPDPTTTQPKPKSTIPGKVTEIPASELNVGWIEPGQPMDKVEQVYGKPGKIDDEGFFQTYNYNDKLVVKGKMNNGYKVTSAASYDKTHKTPSGFGVGDSYASVVKKFGPVKGIKFKGEGVEAKFKGCTDYTYFSGDKQIVFIVDKNDVIRGIRVEELDEQKFIEAKRKK